MFEQSVDQVLKRCKFKRRATANGWSVDKAARVLSDFWDRIKGWSPNEDDLVAKRPAPVIRKDTPPGAPCRLLRLSASRIHPASRTERRWQRARAPLEEATRL